MDSAKDEPRVTIAHARALGYCASGMRAFAATHGLDWMEFLQRGLPACQFDATDDAMGMRAAELAREEHRAKALREKMNG